MPSRGKHRNQGFPHVFGAHVLQQFEHSNPFPSGGIWGAVFLLMLYFIDFLLCRDVWHRLWITITVITIVFLRVIISLFLYITIYILISYIVLENGLDPLFFNCNNCNCNAGVITYSLTSTVSPTKPFLCAYLYPCLSTGQVAYGSGKYQKVSRRDRRWPVICEVDDGLHRSERTG